jgi:hypothetical protein
MWGRQLNREFDVIHDRSKSLAHSVDDLKLLMNQTEPEVEIGYDRRKGVFPLKATGITFVDSNEFPQIQVADLVASGIAATMGGIARQTKDNFLKELKSTRLGNLPLRRIWPSTALSPEELGTEEVGGIDAVEYIARMIHRQRANQNQG